MKVKCQVRMKEDLELGHFKYIYNALGFLAIRMNRVDWLVIEHLNVQGKKDPRGGSIVLSIQTKLESLFWAHTTH